MRRLASLLLPALLALSGCAGKAPIATVKSVDLDRFMGDWYVIGYTPTFLDSDAHNAIESYARNPDGSIATTYRFRQGGFDGPIKVYHPTGFVVEGSGDAVWGMHFVWPFKAEYRVVYLADDYSATIIGRSARDYVWIMARNPQLPEAAYQSLVKRATDLGYSEGQIHAMPQRWPEATR